MAGNGGVGRMAIGLAGLGARKLAVLIAAAVAVGCGGEQQREPESVRSAVPQEPIPVRPGTFQGVGVVLTGLAIRSDSPTVPAGDVSFSVSNAGAQPYRFVVSGKGARFQTGEIAPGGTEVLDASLMPGTYELHTIPEQTGPVPGEIRQMLTVTPGELGERGGTAVTP